MKQAHIFLEKINAKYAILPGDPGRIDKIKKFLDDPKELAFNREFRSLEGKYKEIDIIAVSTGIGGSSASIAIEELNNLGVEAMIRIGSCGALQEGIEIGDLIIVSGAIRDEGTSKAYADIRLPAIPNHQLFFNCLEAVKELNYKHHVGIIHSHESFYIDTNAKEEEYWSKYKALGADMESAALFTVGHIRNIKTASILNNVVEYGKDTSESVSDYQSGENKAQEGEEKEIKVALEALYKLSKQ